MSTETRTAADEPHDAGLRRIQAQREAERAELASLRSAVERVRELCAVEIRIGGEADARINASDVRRALNGEA